MGGGACTVFCEALKTIAPTGSRLPSHDELVTRLRFSEDDREEGRFLGTWNDLVQRAQCGFCQLVAAAVADNSDLTSSGRIPPDQPIRVLIFPGEQSFRLSYPSRIGTRLAFVAEDSHQASGPDTARRVHAPHVQIPQIVGWLNSCDENHKACKFDRNPKQVRSSSQVYSLKGLD